MPDQIKTAKKIMSRIKWILLRDICVIYIREDFDSKGNQQSEVYYEVLVDDSSTDRYDYECTSASECSSTSESVNRLVR